jgi:hypothetical protein
MVNKIPKEYENPFDNLILSFIDTHLEKYYKLGFTPNMITTLSLITGISSAYFITQRQFILAGLLYLISYYFDCVDGKLARKYNMTSVFGDYYDHFSDITKFIIVIYVLYLNDKIKMKKYILLIIILLILTMYQIGCQQALYPMVDTESPTLDMFKASKESCLKNIYHTRYFGCGTITLVLVLIIMFWNKLS